MLKHFKKSSLCFLWRRHVCNLFKSRELYVTSRACGNIHTHVHRGQTSEHAREIARGSHCSIRKTLHVAVTTGASSCELEAQFSFYFNEVHRQGTYDMNYKYA